MNEIASGDSAHQWTMPFGNGLGAKIMCAPLFAPPAAGNALKLGLLKTSVTIMVLSVKAASLCNARNGFDK